MSQVGLSMSSTSPTKGPTAPKKKKSKLLGLVLGVVIVAIIAGAAWFAYSIFFKPAPDYVGEGTGNVVVRIESGSSLSDIGNTLTEKDVVKSSGAFVQAAEANPDSRSIQSGVFSMRLQMSGAAAVDALLNPIRIAGTVAIPEQAEQKRSRSERASAPVQTGLSVPRPHPEQKVALR